MTKHLIDLTVAATERLNATHVLLRLTDTARPLPDMLPGQFVEVRVDHSSTTLLRRPISINFVDRTRNELWLLVHEIGDGTRALGRLAAGDAVNCLLPLGNGFTLPATAAGIALIKTSLEHPPLISPVNVSGECGGTCPLCSPAVVPVTLSFNLAAPGIFHPPHKRLILRHIFRPVPPVGGPHHQPGEIRL